MADSPFGPWRLKAAGSSPGDDGAPADAPKWETGTVIDTYIPVYLALSRPGKDGRAPISPTDADRMDIAVAAALLGAGRSLWDEWEEEMLRGRQEAEQSGERWQWGD